MGKKPMYFQLEPGAFLSDMDFQVMNAEQRGVYCTLIFYLYRNDGKLKHDIPLLTKICNVNNGFDFRGVLDKFQIRRGFIYHKRVTAEFTKSSDRMKADQEWKSKSSQGGIRSARLKKAREKGTHTVLEWQYLVYEAKNICPRCGEFTDRFDKDHVKPIYQDGSDSITNIQPLCSSCNSAKGSESTDYFQVPRSQALIKLESSGVAHRVVEPPLATLSKGKVSKGKVRKEKVTITYNDDKKCFEDVPLEKIQQWGEAFPAVDIALELKSAALWVADNPTKAKSQWGRFLTNWFRRTQERGGNRGKVLKKTIAQKRDEYRRITHDKS